VAQALRGSLRSSDLVARFGGDEFAVLITGLTLRQAESRLNVVVSQLAKASVVPGEASGITVSCGISEVSAGDTVDSLMHRADQALYDAKRLGRNRVAVNAPAFIRDLLKR
jgi:diguanylate cyclase (GGDEF)-like protein